MKKTTSFILLLALFTACGTATKQEVKKETKTDSSKVSVKEVPETEPPENPFVNSILTPGAQSLAASNNTFSEVFYQTLAKKEKDKNLFVSGFSLFHCLGMTLAGSEAVSAQEILQTLRLNNSPIDTIGKNYYNLTGQILKGQSEKTKIYLANSFWIDQSMKIDSEYPQLIEKYFKSPTEKVDLQNPENIKKINTWVSKQTRGKITKILDEDVKDLMAVLINTIYFKSSWSRPFEEYMTKEKDFTLTGGRKIKAQMMFQKGRYRYTENQQIQVLQLNYEGDFSMVVVLPKESIPLASIETTLQGDYLKKIMESMTQQEVIVELPKFKLEFKQELNELLEEMGIHKIFKSGSFKFNPSLYVDKVLQKTIIEVNEETTEAAAVTWEELKKEEAKNEPKKIEPKIFNANRPFYFLIKEDKTNTILFQGRLMNPAIEK